MRGHRCLYLKFIVENIDLRNIQEFIMWLLMYHFIFHGAFRVLCLALAYKTVDCVAHMGE